MTNAINETSSNFTNNISGFFRYAYDQTGDTQTQINDGGSDMFDTGNKVLSLALSTCSQTNFAERFWKHYRDSWTKRPFWWGQTTNHGSSVQTSIFSMDISFCNVKQKVQISFCRIPFKCWSIQCFPPLTWNRSQDSVTQKQIQDTLISISVYLTYNANSMTLMSKFQYSSYKFPCTKNIVYYKQPADWEIVLLTKSKCIKKVVP